MSVDSICIDKPTVETSLDKEQDKGKPVIGGGAMFRGRAVEKLVEGLPTRPWKEFTKSLYEDLEDPKRVHLDSYGNVHLCQGLSMGNMWDTPPSELVKNFNSDTHSICRPLIRGGPALLAKEYEVKHEDEFADACHFCYVVRRILIDRFPQFIIPRLIHGQ